jgi:ferredoxin
MTLADPGACIGCRACSRVCAKGCQTFEAAPAPLSPLSVANGHDHAEEVVP